MLELSLRGIPFADRSAMPHPKNDPKDPKDPHEDREPQRREDGAHDEESDLDDGKPDEDALAEADMEELAEDDLRYMEGPDA